MTITHCVICSATSDEQGEGEEWTPVALIEPIELRSSLLGGALDAFLIPAGLWWLCSSCAAWRPDARTAPPPPRVGAILAVLTDLVESPNLRQQLRRDLLGGFRHLARELRTLAPS